MKRRIVLSYGSDEYLPIFTSIGHNLKEKNVFLCEFEKIVIEGDYQVIRIKPTEEKKINIIVTHSSTGFIRGFLYVDEKEYPVLDCKVYSSMQIENMCYDNIVGIRLPDEFATVLPG
jgi:hypothetical protein